MSIIDHEVEHMCPVYQRVISPDLCYDSTMCLTGMFKIESTKELDEVENIEKARIICKKCFYSDMS